MKIAITLGYPAKSWYVELERLVQETVAALAGADHVEVEIDTKIVGREVQKGVNPIDGVRNMIAIASGKGGVGKTNFSVNTALLLARLNQKVLIIDADIHLGNVDVLFGISPDFTLVDVLKGNKSLKEIIKNTPYGVDFLPATSGVMDMIEGEELVRVAQRR